MEFRFKKFSLAHEHSTMKIGTDAVLLAALTDAQDAHSLLDIGCGCGVVAFCIAQQMAHLQQTPTIYGIDNDLPSIEEAKRNARHYPLLPPDCFHFVHIRLQDWTLQECQPKFDLIVSNPPFFGNDLKPTNASRLKSKHRDNQLSFEELILNVDKLLNEKGRFALILPVTEAEEFQQLAASYFHLTQKTTIRPTAKKPAHRVVLEYARQPESEAVTANSLTIRNEKNEYTSEYLLRVKPYLTLG